MVQNGKLYKTIHWGYLFYEPHKNARYGRADKEVIGPNVIVMVLDQLKIRKIASFKLLLPDGKVLYTPSGKPSIFLKRFELVC